MVAVAAGARARLRAGEDGKTVRINPVLAHRCYPAADIDRDS
jgi:hypothetical protein